MNAQLWDKVIIITHQSTCTLVSLCNVYYGYYIILQLYIQGCTLWSLHNDIMAQSHMREDHLGIVILWKNQPHFGDCMQSNVF